MLFLQTQDYEIKDGKLCIAVDGFTLVFYTADICKICDRLKPQFNRLAKNVQGCTFAYMNVSQDKMKIRKMAAQTGFTIDYVPIFVLYANRIPVAVYNINENNMDSFASDLNKWLVGITTKLMNGPNASVGLQSSRHQQGPKQSRAKPSGRDDVGYKTFNQAYSSVGK